MESPKNNKNLPRLEKVAYTKEVAFEKTKHLFEPLGIEQVDEFNNIVIENESIKLSLKYEKIEFNVFPVPQNEQDLLESGLHFDEKRLLRFLDFHPELYYRLKYYKLENKTNGSSINLQDELDGNIVYIKKQGQDPSNSAADFLNRNIKIDIMPTSVAGILTMFHEIGHKKDPLLHPFVPDKASREYKQTDSANESLVDKERFAWAYCLKRLKPYVPVLGITDEDLDIFVHKWALGTYSAAIDPSIIKPDPKKVMESLLKLLKK